MIQLVNDLMNWIDSSPKRTYKWPVDCQNLFNILPQPSTNVSENCYDIPVHQSEWPWPRKQMATNSGKDERKEDSLNIICENMNCFGHYRILCGDYSKNENRTIKRPSYTILGYICKYSVTILHRCIHIHTYYSSVHSS